MGVELFLDKRQIALPIPCPGGYTGGADSVHSAHPPLKCRTAATWQYAVWSESAGNGPGTEKIQDYGLLICQPNGCPIDPNNLCKAFKKWQASMHIEDQIEFQGLRKSGQMHKIRLSKNNYQLVAESAGQSPEVLMSNYNEALEDEKRTLSLLIETDFYPSTAVTPSIPSSSSLDAELLMEKVKADPGFSAQLLQLLSRNAINPS